jgi:hypothetical protein
MYPITLSTYSNMRIRVESNVLLIISLLTGCAGEMFVSNDSRISVSSSQLSMLRSNWKNDTSTIVAASEVDQADKQWVFDFIAQTHNSLQPSCHNLVLDSIEHHPLRPFSIQEGSTGKFTTFRPQKYLESWFITVCDKKIEWRIVDDPDDKRYEAVTPLLWKQ